MITKAKLEELRQLVKDAGERFDFGGLPLPDIFDTISTLYQQNEELKSSRPNYCVECGTGVRMMCASCCAKHLHKLERVAKAAEEHVHGEYWPVDEKCLVCEALAALREGE